MGWGGGGRGGGGGGGGCKKPGHARPAQVVTFSCSRKFSRGAAHGIIKPHILINT